MSNKTPLKLFYSYSHKDEVLRDELDAHLKILERQGYISSWHDRKITAGDEWKGQIDENLKSAEIILLLISSDFIASDYCYDIEMDLALKMHEDRTAKVIPIILRECVWSIAPFNKLQALPTDGKAITGEDWHNKDKAFRIVTEGLKKGIDEFRNNSENILNTLEPTVYRKNQLKQIPISKPYFSGRELELEKLKELFETKHFIFVEGAGGIGKTQFISKFINDLGIKDKTIWYECHPTSQPDDIIRGSGFEEILLGSDKTEREKYVAFKDKIEEYGLVVFLDNYQDVQLNKNFQSFLSFINDYLSIGQVIVIGRDNISSATIHPAKIHLEGLGDSSLMHAQRLLQHSFPERGYVDEEILRNICNSLLGYPLAIDLAMYLLSQNVPYEKILEVAVLEAQNSGEKISERLLNEIFTRQDATEEERQFLKDFSIYRGKVELDAIEVITDRNSIEIAIRKLLNKNLLTVEGDYYELHPLIREFCYEKLDNKKEKHSLAADYFSRLRTQVFDPVLEEKLYYHLSCAELWIEITAVIEEKGQEFISQGYLDRLKQMILTVRTNGCDRAVFYILEGDIEQIKGNWNESLNIFKNVVDDDGFNYEAIIKYGEMLFRTSKSKEALVQYEKVLNLIEDENNVWVARAYNNIGLIYTYTDSKRALKFLNKALVLREVLGDLGDIATTLHNISTLKSESFDYPNALRLAERALKICIQINDKLSQAKYLSNIGHVKLRQKDLKDAFIYFDKAFDICRAIGDKMGIAVCYGHLGNYYRRIKNPQKALEYYNEYYKISDEVGSKQSLNVCHSNIGILLFEDLDDADNSCLHLMKSLAITKEIDSYNVNSLTCMRNIKNKIGAANYRELVNRNYDKLDVLKQFISIQDVLGEPVSTIKVGRNEICPCGSGLKYKKCHGVSS